MALKLIFSESFLFRFALQREIALLRKSLKIFNLFESSDDSFASQPLPCINISIIPRLSEEVIQSNFTSKLLFPSVTFIEATFAGTISFDVSSALTKFYSYKRS